MHFVKRNYREKCRRATELKLEVDHHPKELMHLYTVILEKTKRLSWYYCAAAIRAVKKEIFKKPKTIGETIRTMAKNRRYRTLDEVSEEYYRNHPDEIDGYLKTCFEEYAKDGQTQALLSSLRMIARVKGISVIAEETGMTRNGIQNASLKEVIRN